MFPERDTATAARQPEVESVQPSQVDSIARLQRDVDAERTQLEKKLSSPRNHSAVFVWFLDLQYASR